MCLHQAPMRVVPTSDYVGAPAWTSRRCSTIMHQSITMSRPACRARSGLGESPTTAMIRDSFSMRSMLLIGFTRTLSNSHTLKLYDGYHPGQEALGHQ